MTDCDHPWATQDEIGRPYCQACGKPWEQVRKEEAMNDVKELRAEIDRLQEAKRRALKLADERAKEANRLRAALGQIAGKNDLSGVPTADLESAARNALYECELIAREALDADHSDVLTMDELNADLRAMRRRHGYDSQIGNRCTHLMQTFRAYGAATDEKRQAELEKRIRLQFAEIALASSRVGA